MAMSNSLAKLNWNCREPGKWVWPASVALFLFLFFLLYPLVILAGSDHDKDQGDNRSDGSPSIDQKPQEEGQEEGLGIKEMQGTDGRKDKVYYSIITEEEEKASRQKEKAKEDKSWEMLHNIIIDQTSGKGHR
jgi:hypothetical protein